MEATIAAHDDLGISGASLRDIAQRAGVAPSTILQHFPDRNELIRACGELSEALLPMPTDEVFADVDDESERVSRMATSLFSWWDAMGPGFDHLRTDRRRIPAVESWFGDLERTHRALAVAALSDAGPARVTALMALTTPDAWTALRASGLDAASAGRLVARLICGPRPVPA